MAVEWPQTSVTVAVGLKSSATAVDFGLRSNTGTQYVIRCILHSPFVKRTYFESSLSTKYFFFLFHPYCPSNFLVFQCFSNLYTVLKIYLFEWLQRRPYVAFTRFIEFRTSLSFFQSNWLFEAGGCQCNSNLNSLPLLPVSTFYLKSLFPSTSTLF